MREVSSPMLSRPNAAPSRGGKPESLRGRLTRLCTSSAMYRDMPASSRVALK